MALNTLMRIVEGAPEIGPAMREDETFRVRLIALLGGSSAFGDHLAAHPEAWHELQRALPTPTEMLHTLLTEVGAEPATYVEQPDQPDTASPDLTSPGTYRAAPGTTKHHSKWPTEH